MPRKAFGLLSSGLALCMWLGVSQLATACGSDDEGEHSHDDGHAGDHDADHDHDKPVGPPSGATCPDGGSTLTYENFGEAFFADYCLSCHSKEVEGAARKNAPEDHNFDTLAEIALLAEHIDQMAAYGPDSKNVTMPPVEAAKKPTAEQREKLGEWLACGAK